MGAMPASPRGRTITEVDGSPSEIIARGTAIETLGGQMRDSADVMKSIESRAADQQGKAISSLQDSIGDSYTVLYEAADLYEPVGPVIKTYGEALDAVKPKLDGHTTECETLWNTYDALAGSVDPRGTGGFGEPDEDSDEAKENAEEDQAKKAAYDAWEDEADLFDADYDTWEEAYDTAVDNIGKEMAGSIKDSFWDDWGDFIMDALSWASFVLGIAALIIGGPILAALALVAGVLYLAATIVNVSQGKGSGWDIAFAALGVLPFGKLGNLTKLAHLGRGGGKAFLKGGLGGIKAIKGKPFSLGSNSIAKSLRSGKGPGGAAKAYFTGGKTFKSTYRGQKQFYQGPGQALANMRNGNAVRNLAMIEYGSGIASKTTDLYNKAEFLSSHTPLPDIPAIPAPVKVFI